MEDGEPHTYSKIGVEKLNFGIGKPKKILFGLLVTSVVLYGCEIWGSNMSTRRWRQLERIQKQLITCNLKVKATVPYEILFAETSTFSLEATTITKLISYLKKVENMDNQHLAQVSYGGGVRL
jgi:hypothetical protein